MRRIIIAVFTVTAAMNGLGWTSKAAAQNGRDENEFDSHHAVEVAVMGSITTIMSAHEDNTTTIAMPTAPELSLTPGLRLTFWRPSHLMIDLGSTYMHAGSGSLGASLLQLECGIGADLSRSDAENHRRFANPSTHPSVGFLVGVLSLSGDGGGTHSEAYVGGQLGVREFFRDDAAIRFQFAYRHTLGNVFDFDSIELAGGLSFFL